MKPNEYIKKYNLKDPTSDFNGGEFIADLAIDFNAMVEFHRQTNWSYAKFELCVKDIKSKLNSIIIKTAHQYITERTWGYFYATIVGPMKRAMFGDQLRREQEKREEREKLNREWRKDFDRRSAEYFRDFWEEEFVRMLGAMFGGARTKPTSSFAALGLTDTATKDDVRKRYRELAFQHHPDRGGSPGEFRKITEARDRCLMYV